MGITMQKHTWVSLHLHAVHMTKVCQSASGTFAAIEIINLLTNLCLWNRGSETYAWASLGDF